MKRFVREYAADKKSRVREEDVSENAKQVVALIDEIVKACYLGFISVDDAMKGIADSY